MAIESRWFRVRVIGSGDTPEDARRPEYSDRLDGYSAFQLGDSPMMVMRAYGEPSVLDGIAAEPRANEIPASEALRLFNQSDHPSIGGLTFGSIVELKRKIHVGLG